MHILKEINLEDIVDEWKLTFANRSNKRRRGSQILVVENMQFSI